MNFDFKTLKPNTSEFRPVEPIQLFRSFRVKDSAVNDLWLGQADALQPWHKIREKKDIVIGLNTGAGKTLVGLLMAQSLVNETRGKVIYACNSIQLVQQTQEKASGYGMDVCTYFRGDFSNQLYDQGRAPCITTYQALFNGKSRFFQEDIAAVIFDDAHTAENVLRDQFTLTIKFSSLDEAYKELIAEFREYFIRSGQAATFEEIATENSGRILIIPPFEIKKRHLAILAILRNSEPAKKDETRYAWEHLKDRLDLCCYLITGGSIVITPPFIPVQKLPYFAGETRRVYLSATLNAPDSFARTFGKIPDHIISPNTQAGACERMILAPILRQGVKKDVEIVSGIIKKRKALIMTPTYSRSAKWEAIAKPPEKEEVTKAVTHFKAASSPAKLLLTARYDGVDLPGDTCRLMVIDDLPCGTGLLERFLWEYLRMSHTLRTTIASRIVQSFGRISRGMSDYGIVFLTGESLIKWLSVHQNLISLPSFLQKQLQLGQQMSETMKEGQITSAIDSCLSRDQNWTKVYENFMDQAVPTLEIRNTDVETELAVSESKFATAMWNREYTVAVLALSKTRQKASHLSASTHAWHLLWMAYATELAGDARNAEELYRRANGAQRNLPAPPLVPAAEQAKNVDEQAKNAAMQFRISPNGDVQCPKDMDQKLSHLINGGSSAQIEESIRFLGILLGVASTRPDKEEGTGPDNLWVQEKTALCIDAKTDKTENAKYRKSDEIGQMSDHKEWVKANCDVDTIIPVFVGPELPASEESNPPTDLLVVTREKLGAFAEALCVTYRDIAVSSVPLTLAPKIDEEFKKRGFQLSSLLKELNPVRLIDIGNPEE